MMHDSKPEQTSIDSRIEQESDKLQELQVRWDGAIDKLREYFEIEEKYEDPNDLLRSLEEKTLEEFSLDDRPVAFGFAGPGGAGKGTVREQLADSVKTLQGINSTTRDRRDYEVDGVHYNFVTIEDLVKEVSLTEESTKQVKEFLNIPDDFELRSEILDEIGAKIEKENITDGITLSVKEGSNYLNLTYRPGRGWYGIGSDTFNRLNTGDLITIEESGSNLVLIGDSLDKEGINYSDSIYPSSSAYC